MCAVEVQKPLQEAAGPGPKNVPRLDRSPVRRLLRLAIGDQPDSRAMTSRAGNTAYSVVNAALEEMLASFAPSAA